MINYFLIAKTEDHYWAAFSNYNFTKARKWDWGTIKTEGKSLCSYGKRDWAFATIIFREKRPK